MFHGLRSFELLQAPDNVALIAHLLIRPDGYVAWAVDGEPDPDQLRKALTRWFG